MILGSLIKRGLHRVLKPNETLKESFANPKFLLFRVLLQGCNFIKIKDSRHFQLSIYTVFDEESDFQVKNWGGACSASRREAGPFPLQGRGEVIARNPPERF